MTYTVLLSPKSRQDILETAAYIQWQGGKDRAAHWKNELLKAIASLQEMPFHCPMADESEDVGLELRELHYRTHRVIFAVNEAANTVQVLRVYHSSRDSFHIEDLP